MTKLRSLLLLGAVAAASFAPRAVGQTVPPFTSSASDELFRQSALSAQRSGGNPYRPAFTTSDERRLTMFGRFPFTTDSRHPQIPLSNGWTLGLTNDQYGRSAGFARRAPDIPALGLSDGVIRFGAMKERVLTTDGKSRTAAGLSISYSW